MKNMKRKNPIRLVVCAAVLALATVLSGCNVDPEQIADLVGAMAQNPGKTQEIMQEAADAEGARTDAATADAGETGTDAADGKTEDPSKAVSDGDADEDTPRLPDRDIYIICTSDIHCGIDQGFGYAGLAQILDNIRAQGADIILVDNGDHVQGEPIGTITEGQAIIPIMNSLGYDVAIPGNHEFDYGIEEFFKYPELADFPYISCNRSGS